METIEQLEQLDALFHSLTCEEQILCMEQFQSIIKKLHKITNKEAKDTWIQANKCICGCQGTFECVKQPL